MRRVATGWLSRDKTPRHHSGRRQDLEKAMTGSQLSETVRFTGSCCWSGHRSSSSRSGHIASHTAHCGLYGDCKHSQRRWFSARCGAQGGRMIHTGQQRAHSRGSGRPRRARRAGSTCCPILAEAGEDFVVRCQVSDSKFLLQFDRCRDTMLRATAQRSHAV